MKIIKYTAIIICVIFALIAGIIVAVNFIISPDAIGNKITQTINEKTGYHLAFEGEPQLNIFPSVGITLKGIKVKTHNQNDNPDTTKHVMEAENLSAKVALIPLISKKIEIQEFVVNAPQFNLFVDKDGYNNWSSTQQESQSRDKTEDEREDNQWHISSAPMRLINGKITYQNQRQKQKINIKNINLTISMQEAGSPSSISGLLTWNKGQISVEGEINDLQQIISGKNPADIRFAISFPHGMIDVDGNIQTGNKKEINANTKIQINALKKMLQWSGIKNHNPNIPKIIALNAKTHITNETITISQIVANADKTNLKGNVSFKRENKKSTINAKFNIDDINLDAFINQNAKNKNNKTDNSQQTKKNINQNQNLNNNPDIPTFKNMDANMILNVERATWNKLTVENIKINADIKKNQLNAKLTQADIDKGKLTSEIIVNTNGDVPKISAIADIKNVNAAQLLKDIYDISWMQGTANGNLNLEANAKKWNQIIPNLKGNAQVKITNGAVKGINLAKIIRGIEKNILTGWQNETDQQTDFTNINAQFILDKGIIHNTSVTMVGPIINVTGNGKIHLQHKFIDYNLKPEIVGQNQNTILADIPVIIKGPWDNPSIYPDVQGILENPTAIYEKLKNLKNISTENIKKDVLNKITGDAKDVKKQGEKILKQIFGN